MKTMLAYLAAAVVLLVAVGFAVGWFTWTNEGDHSTIRVETQKLDQAGEKTSQAAADVFEDVGDAVRVGGRKLEEVGDELQQETSDERLDPVGEP